MNKSERRDDLADHQTEHLQAVQPNAATSGRDARGRFTPGNPGGPVTAAERGQFAPSPNGGASADPRRRATPPSTNGPTFKDEPPQRQSGNGDNGGRLPQSPRPKQRPPEAP
jgi:hypothetical protein